ncbi:unnamed protein product, partial [Polarella glacialis]
HSISPICAHLLHVESMARTILVVEKETVFHRLLSEGVLERHRPCVIVTAKGFPDVPTRYLLRRLREDCARPRILVLVDFDASGLAIAATYAFGPESGWVQDDLTLPEAVPLFCPGGAPSAAKRFGLRPGDVLPMTRRDRAALPSVAEGLLRRVAQLRLRLRPEEGGLMSAFEGAQRAVSEITTSVEVFCAHSVWKLPRALLALAVTLLMTKHVSDEQVCLGDIYANIPESYSSDTILCQSVHTMEETEVARAEHEGRRVTLRAFEAAVSALLEGGVNYELDALDHLSDLVADGVLSEDFHGSQFASEQGRSESLSASLFAVCGKTALSQAERSGGLPSDSGAKSSTNRGGRAEKAEVFVPKGAQRQRRAEDQRDPRGSEVDDFDSMLDGSTTTSEAPDHPFCDEFVVLGGTCGAMVLLAAAAVGLTAANSYCLPAARQWRDWHCRCRYAYAYSFSHRLFGPDSDDYQEGRVIPQCFRCPISQEDPVITVDGHTYERQGIEEWFHQGRRTSPLTNLIPA